MARLTFPNSEDRLVYTIESASDFKPSVGRLIRIYSNSAATTLADIQTTAGVPIANAELTVDGNSLLPFFLGPDGVDTLWAKAVGSSSITEIHADTDARLDSLTTSLSAVVTGSGFVTTETANSTYEASVIVPAPTGVNDTSAIATALALAISTGRDLVFQAGTYLTDKISYLPGNAAQTINWRGAGRNTTTIQKRTADGNSLLQINASTATFYISGFTIEGITFRGIAGNTPQVVQANDLARVLFRECVFKTGVVGFQARGGVGNRFDDCEFSGCVNGFVADKYTSFAGFPNLNALTNCEVLDNTGWGIIFDGGRSLQVIDCDIEGNGTTGVADSGGVKVGSLIGSEDGSLVLGITIQRGWLETCSGGAVVSLASGRNKLDNTFMAANPNATNDLKVTGGRYVMVDCDIDTNKAVSVNDTTTLMPNYITNTDIVGGVTIDATKTLYDVGVWAAYSPNIAGTGWAIGNGTMIGRYRQIGKLVHFQIFVTFGTTSTFGSASPTFNYPLALIDTISPQLYAEANSLGSNIYLLYPTTASTSRVRINTIGGSGASAATTSTVPFVWKATDTLTISGTYHAA